MKKVVSFLLSFVLLISLVPATLAASFKDVPSSYRFYQEINYLIERGIISGFPDNTFRPETSVTRAQAAIMIGRALGLDGTQQNTKFPDVGKDSVASGYIQSAVSEGIIQGFPDGTFRPNQSVTRGQLAIFLSRAFDIQETTTVTFKDVSSTSAAYPYIGKLLAAGITTGYIDNTYRPDQAVTRGQFSAFIARTLDSKFIPKAEEEAEKNTETVSQTQAVRSAESYLDFIAFSRSGLIEQLEYEGFSNSDATYAVDKLNVDWNEQAVKSAENYLDFTSFSRSGLIEQLEYEGFTTEQATYAVNQVGL